MAGNQEVAEQIAAALRDSGQLHGYRVGVKYQDGTAWLKGQVASREEMSTAMQLVFSVAGVTRVVNHLTIAGEQPNLALNAPTESAATGALLQPTEGATSAEQMPRPAARDKVQPSSRESAPNQAQRLAANFAAPAEREVAVTALQEPTLAPPKPNAESAPAIRTTVKPAAEATAAPATTVRPARPMPLAYGNTPLPMARVNAQAAPQQPMAIPTGAAPARYDQPNMPNYAWPSYAAYPNYAALTYPKQYSPTAWPYIGPFYPYPQVPLGWRKVSLEWHGGWWALDFDDGTAKGPFSGLYRPCRRKY
jgi:hypothetical protein